jgi:hypothetical protein
MFNFSLIAAVLLSGAQPPAVQCVHYQDTVLIGRPVPAAIARRIRMEQRQVLYRGGSKPTAVLGDGNRGPCGPSLLLRRRQILKLLAGTRGREGEHTADVDGGTHDEEAARYLSIAR